MKKIFLSIISALSISVFITPYNAECAGKSGYTYKTENGRAIVDGFTGEPVSLEIPEIIDGCRVTEIDSNAFYECITLKSIKIPDTVEKIGHHAFYSCSSLENINIPDSVKEMGMDCFSGDLSLVYASIPESISALPESCFRNCKSLESIVLPDSVTIINDFCFSGCTSLSTVSLGGNTQKLGDCAFYMCDSLAGLYIPPSVTEIGLHAAGFTSTNKGTSKSDGFFILGNKKSAAEKYARENSVAFETAPDSVHAVAIQRTNGKRVYIPSALMTAFILLISALSAVIYFRKSSRKK